MSLISIPTVEDDDPGPTDQAWTQEGWVPDYNSDEVPPADDRDWDDIPIATYEPTAEVDPEVQRAKALAEAFAKDSAE